MKLSLAVLMLLVALALVPFAWDWRSPFLADIRPQMFMGLVALALSVILAEVWVLLTSRREQRVLRVVSALGLLAATLAVIAGMVRGEWKHDGVLITDNFSMIAVYRSKTGIDNGSIAALNAGVDLILVSWDADQYYRIMYALLKTDKQGRLNEEILQRSDKRLTRAIRSIR